MTTVCTVTPADLEGIGAAVLSMVTATVCLGHEDPGMTLDYIAEAMTGALGDDAAPEIALDFIAWVARRQQLRPGAEERLRAFVVKSGWLDQSLAQMAERRAHASP